MNNYLGDIAEDADIYICFDTADDTGLSITATVAVSDIEVYRQNTGAINLTQRSSTTGFTLDVDHDAMTGTHMVAIDTSDDTDAGFFAVGYDYFVKLNTVTVDSISISKWIGHFSIENRYQQQTGDSFARIGATGSGLTSLSTQASVDTIDGIVDTLLSRIIGTLAAGTHNPASAAQIAVLSDWINAGRLDTILDTIATDSARLTAVRAAVLTDWINGERLDLLLDAIPTTAMRGTDNAATETKQDATDIVIGELTTQGDTNEAAIGALNDLSAANILTQVNAALDTAISELGVAAPTATPTMRTGLMLMYMMARNRVDVDTTGTDALKIYNDAGTMITSKAITDDGTDYSEAEMS